MRQRLLTPEQVQPVMTQQRAICMDTARQMHQLEQVRQWWQQDKRPVEPEIAHLVERLLREETLRVQERYQQAEGLLRYAQYCLATYQQQR